MNNDDDSTTGTCRDCGAVTKLGPNGTPYHRCWRCHNGEPVHATEPPPPTFDVGQSDAAFQRALELAGEAP